MIILWIIKDFPGISMIGNYLFQDGYIGDGTVAMLCEILPLIISNANPLQSKPG